MEQVNVMLESLRTFWMQVVLFLPKLIGAVLILIVGWVLAKFVRKATLKALKFIRLDVIAEKSGIEDFLVKGGVRLTTVTILGNLVYWLIMFIVFLAVLNSLGMEVAADLFNKIILYIPNVIVAVIILIFGTMFAKFAQGITLTYLKNVGVGGARAMSIIAQYAILVFVVSLTLEQLAIGGLVLVSAFQIAFGALALALALAFGLGGREWASHVLKRLWKKS